MGGRDIPRERAARIIREMGLGDVIGCLWGPDLAHAQAGTVRSAFTLTIRTAADNIAGGRKLPDEPLAVSNHPDRDGGGGLA